jgi:hypothetical protein
MLTSALIEAMALEFGENPQDGDVVAALLGMIRDVVQDINMQGEWQHTRLVFPFETVASDNSVPLPETAGSIVAVQRVDTGRPLQYINIETLTDGSLILADEGEPAFWHYEVIDDGVSKLRLYPTPDAAYSYQVFYETSTHDIASEDASLPLPNDFIPVLKHGVRVMYYSQANEPNQVQLYNSRFQQGIQFMRSRYEHIRRDSQSSQYNDIDSQASWPTPQLGTSYERIG